MLREQLKERVYDLTLIARRGDTDWAQCCLTWAAAEEDVLELCFAFKYVCCLTWLLMTEASLPES